MAELTYNEAQDALLRASNALPALARAIDALAKAESVEGAVRTYTAQIPKLQSDFEAAGVKLADVNGKLADATSALQAIADRIQQRIANELKEIADATAGAKVRFDRMAADLKKNYEAAKADLDLELSTAATAVNVERDKLTAIRKTLKQAASAATEAAEQAGG
jgi:hypothetical protein